MTNDVDPGSNGPSSWTILLALFLARVGFTAEPVELVIFAVRFRAVVFLAVLAFAISSVP
jgi:hypothetical protein